MRKLLLCLTAASLVACGGDSTGPIASAAGTWNLQTINGTALPFTAVYVASPLYKLEILSDTFVASSNGSYVENFSIRETDGSTVTTQNGSDHGTWVQNNGALTITASDGTVSSAAITGDVITANIDGDVYVYHRQ